MALQTASPVALVVAVALAGAGVLALGFALREAPAVYRLLTARSIDVVSLVTEPNGPASIAGRAVRNEESLIAPFTGRECLAVTYEVQEERTTKHGTTWTEIDDGRGAVAFRLEDDTGSVLVDPSTVRLSLRKRESTIEVGSDEDPPERIREYIERDPDVDSAQYTLDLRVIELDVGDDRRYVERRLEPGDEVRVIGEARERPGVGRAVGQVNAVLESGAHPLIVTDASLSRTLLGVFWPVLLAGGLGVVLLAGGLLVAF